MQTLSSVEFSLYKIFGTYKIRLKNILQDYKKHVSLRKNSWKLMYRFTRKCKQEVKENRVLFPNIIENELFLKSE